MVSEPDWVTEVVAVSVVGPGTWVVTTPAVLVKTPAVSASTGPTTQTAMWASGSPASATGSEAGQLQSGMSTVGSETAMSVSTVSPMFSTVSL